MQFRTFVGLLLSMFRQCGKLKPPPKIHFFLWLVSHNKLLTRDNLVKRQQVDDLTCVFCSEPETCSHLFFECVVSKNIRAELKTLNDINYDGVSLESIASMWICEKKFMVQNTVHAAAMWST